MRIDDISLDGSTMSFSVDEDAMALLAQEGMKYLLLKSALQVTDNSLFEWLQLGRSKSFADRILIYANDNNVKLANENYVISLIENCLTYEEALQKVLEANI